MTKNPREHLFYTCVSVLLALAAFGYAVLFFGSLDGRFFDPRWTTDDALQQVYPFWEAVYPNLFRGDLITEVMKGYLAPIHYWLGMSITHLTGNPLLTAHWMHAIQLVGAVVFLFLLVRRCAGTPAACFAVLWLLHTRPIMQRLTAGLPRGWSALVICCFLYFFIRKDYRTVLVVLFFGCLLHPPTTMICGLAYGIWLTSQVLFSGKRREYLRPFWTLVFLTPIYALVTYSVVQRPQYIGSMVTLEQAEAIPEFQFPGGRFPFVPLQDLKAEVRTFAFQAFIGRFDSGTVFENFKDGIFHSLRKHARLLILLALISLIGFSLIFKTHLVPSQLWAFLGASVLVYLAARQLAFLLYVPNRHLQFPLAFFFIVSFSIGFWNLGHKLGRFSRGTYRPIVSLMLFAVLGFFVYCNSGDGLKGDLNFNYSVDKRGGVFAWVQQNTKEHEVVAGHPTFIDGLMLFARRRGFITTETYHPFYPEYLLEVRRRIDLSLRAHYASSLQEFSDILENERIDYFVFERARFYPEALEKNTFQLPHTALAKKLGSRHWSDYAYREIPSQIDVEIAPFQVFRDSRSVIVDMRLLRDFLSNRQINLVSQMQEDMTVQATQEETRDEAL